MSDSVARPHHDSFESLRRVGDDGSEYWLARELMPVLEYETWQSATQTEEKLRRDEIKGKEAANKTHEEVGCRVRQTIEDIGGTMPEDLPTPETSVKKLGEEEQKRLEGGDE